jgi:hypothetical protein
MKTKLTLALAALATTLALPAKQPAPAISGDYLEVRSCDIYTGACIANSEMGLTGKEGMLVWRVKHGAWKGAALDGLSVLAVVQTDDTLGDVSLNPGAGRAVLIVDSRASCSQQEALADFARAQAGKLIKDVAAVKIAAVEVKMGQCKSGACATVKAGDLVEISTRCLGGNDHLCGNEENYYPPLTKVDGAFSAYTELAAFRGRDLNATWQLAGRRSAYLGTFAQ